MSTTTTTTTATTTAREALLNVFTETLEQLLGGLHDSFPECAMTAQVFMNFRTVVMNNATMREQALLQWHAALKNYYAAFAQHDIATLEKATIPLVGVLNVFNKFRDPDLSDESRSVLWQYLEELNGYAQQYTAVQSLCAAPAASGMMTRIENVVSQVASAAQNGFAGGGGGANNSPALNIQALTASVMDGASDEDMEGFVQQMPALLQNFGGIDNLLKMASSMQSMMQDHPAAAQMMQQAQSMLQGVDMTQIADLLGGASGGGGGPNAAADN